MVKRLSDTDQNSRALTNVPTPSAAGDAANKGYVDGKSFPTNITITHNTSTLVVNSDTGTDGTINSATTSVAGAMSSADKTKLDGIATGAQVNSFVRVVHGATASTARPSATHVEWVGSVAPTNGTTADTWIDTA